MSATEDEAAESIRLIRDSARAIADPANLKRARAQRFEEPGFDPGLWREIGELGWIGLAVPEAAGGSGLGMREFCALAEEFGAALTPEPLVPCALSAHLLAACDDHGALPQLLTGEMVIATAWQEAPNTLEAPGTPDAPRIFVPAAAGADVFLLPVRDGKTLALYEVLAAGCEVSPEALQDGGYQGTVRADLSRGKKLSSDIGAALSVGLDRAALATAAVMLGVMDRAFAMTLDYLKTRTQFGKPIGSFQALQHRAADLKIQVALTRASVEAAAAAFDSGAMPQACRAAASRAKHRASESGMLVTRQAIQLHGGIGYTDEHDVGLYLRRAMVLMNQFGSAALHRSRFMSAAPEETDD
ncbi:acyl-CoA dehydrogenase family protein [Roseomonas sp. CCTCC AB2023176]|uniref:acyl-CoA dehydrogenase family protein n=1 Tax=Roseomonas sp. CCTCC AB2023176 TaxID=3342640 RepID=UPI0035E13B4E